MRTARPALRPRAYAVLGFGDAARLPADGAARWWRYAHKYSRTKRLRYPGLAQLAVDETLAWQHEHLRWGWTAVHAVDATRVESDLIAAHRPLGNLAGRGYQAGPPAPLRAIGGYERERAWWLFHVAWLAVLTLGTPSEGIRRRRLQHEVAHDEHGWPVPLGEGEHRPGPGRARVATTA
jgi:hypothetical protein